MFRIRLKFFADAQGSLCREAKLSCREIELFMNSLESCEFLCDELPLTRLIGFRTRRFDVGEIIPPNYCNAWCLSHESSVFTVSSEVFRILTRSTSSPRENSSPFESRVALAI